MNSSNPLTFFYTDIEGSTRLWEQAPQAMRSAIDEHDRILRTCIESNGGVIFRTAGDAVCAYFTSATSTVDAAVAARRALTAHAWPLPEPLKVRFVLHSSEAEPYHGDFVGGSLNRLGRMLAVCHGGQTLVSHTTEEFVRDHLPPGVNLVDLGLHRFRDLVRPERIFQLNLSDLPNDFPPLKTLDAYAHNLPIQLTSFIGREHELYEVRRLLKQTRLLTLTGPGGTGKTRLALQAAAEQIDHFPDGVWLVELAPLSASSLVLPYLASIVGVREQSDNQLADTLIKTIRDRTMLLLLDNCEHLIDTCAHLAELILQNGSSISILASSREALGIGGEVTLRLPSLSLPDENEVLDVSSLDRYEAVTLFVDRAKAVQPGFQINPKNAAAVVQICRRLDGIPLAIELAASRVKLLSVDQIAARLDDRFRLLTGGSRTALPRQQTLSALIDWSYDLLSDNERLLLRRLSVFSGGCTVEAAEFICAFDGTIDILHDLEQLVNKSLVIAVTGESETRFHFLETIRQYAAEKLLASGEATQIRSRHLDYYFQFSLKNWTNLFESSQVEWLSTLKKEHDNIRIAFDWAMEEDIDKALEIGGEMAMYWSRFLHGSEGRRRLNDVLLRAEQLPPHPGTERQREVGLAKAFVGLGLIQIIQGDNLAGFQSFEQGVQKWRSLGDETRLSFALGLSGETAMFLGQFDLGTSLAEESLALARKNGNPYFEGLALTVLGGVAGIFRGDFAYARQVLEEGISLLNPSDVWLVSFSISWLGIAYYHLKDLEKAQFWLKHGEEIANRTGDPYLINVNRSAIADISRAANQVPKAILLYVETIKTWRTLGNQGAVARCLECMAFMLIDRFEKTSQGEDVYNAGILIGAAAAIRKHSGSEMLPYEVTEYERYLQAAQSSSSADRYCAGWGTGQTLDLDATIEFAARLSAIIRE